MLNHRQLCTCRSCSSASWLSRTRIPHPGSIYHIKVLLRQYDLPSIYEIPNHPPTKSSWKKQVRDAVDSHWNQTLCDQAASMTSLQYINIEQCDISTPNPVWQNVRSPMDIMKATVKAQIMVQRYPLATSHTAGSRKSPLCPICGKEPEDTMHFLLQCDTLMSVRRPYLKHIFNTCRQQQIDINLNNLVRIVLDSTWLRRDDDRHEEV